CLRGVHQMTDWRYWPALTSKPYRHSWADMSEDMPVDVLPCSNDEYFPPPPSREQIAIMELASREAERMRLRLGLSRRNFVPTARSAPGRLDPRRRRRRDRPDREPLPLPLPEGDLPRLGHVGHGAVGRTDLAGHQQPAAAGGGGPHGAHRERPRPLEALGDAR